MSRDIKYMGMDVHKEAIVIAVRNHSGKLVMESIVETKASSILQFIHGLQGELHVTWEEGTWAAWLYDLLKPQVHEVLVCNPRRNALLKEGNKSDKIDARKLADLLRTGMLRPVYHGEHGPRDAVSQDSLEMRGILGVHELAGPRQVEIVETRQPEPKRGRAQERGPLRTFVAFERAHRLVPADERLDQLRDKCPARVACANNAPIVDGNGEIVGEEVGGGESEVDDARHPGALEQHVVAEQVAVDRRARQCPLAVTCLKFDLGGE